MSISYEQWCAERRNIRKFARSLSSSVPEQYIGFYLQKAFAENLEYQKRFDWLGYRSLDIYVPSLKLAIEYDGEYYHTERRYLDNSKTNICKEHGIYVFRIIELSVDEKLALKNNEIAYYYDKNYKNIAIAIASLFEKINRKYRLTLECDVNVKRDENVIISYIQRKFYERSVAYVWPESLAYWDNEANGNTAFDVLYTAKKEALLKCPHCGKSFTFYMRYFHRRKSLIPCECEYEETDNDLKRAIADYAQSGQIVSFDNSLRSRRLYDKMMLRMQHYLLDASKEELLMYDALGFDLPIFQMYISKFK